MYRPLIPLIVVALGLPAYAQITTESSRTTALAGTAISSRLSEPNSPLTLSQAIDLTTRANPHLSAARHELQALEATVIQAGARPNPTLDFEAQDTRRETRETTFQVSQAVELGGKRARRVDAAERSKEVANADLRANFADIRANVSIAFNDVLIAQERVRLAQESLDVATRLTTTVSKRVQAGKISPVDETRSRVAEANVRLEALKVAGELATARKALSSFWGNLVPQFELAVDNIESLPDLPPWADLSARLAGTPTRARARLEIERRRALVRLEESRRTPDVTVRLGLKRSAELGLNQAIFGLSVPLPLFDRNRGNVLEALRRTDTAEDELIAAETESHKELAQAYQELSTARQEAQTLAKEILPGAQSAYDAAVKGFEFGKFAYFDVLDAQRTLIQSKSQYLRALSESRRAAANIGRIVGDAASGTP